MSLLTVVRNVCGRIGIPSPAVVVSNTELQIQQLLALANEEGEELAQRHAWQMLTQEATFTTVAATSQGALTTLAGPSFGWIVSDTIWNRTQRRPIYGPKSAQERQAIINSAISGPFLKYYLRGGELQIIPNPPVADVCFFEWVSENWCQSAGSVKQSAWAADTDTGLLDEGLMTAGIIWRWRQAKGFDYAEDFRKYEMRLEAEIGREKSSPVLSMSRRGDRQRFISGANVPDTGYGA